MKYKKLAVVIMLSGLIGVNAFIMLNDKVQASYTPHPSWYYHAPQKDGNNFNWHMKRYVKLTKPVRVYKIHWKSLMYRSTTHYYKTLRKGTHVYIYQPGVNFGWYVYGKGLKGASSKHNLYTVKKSTRDYSWFLAPFYGQKGGK